MDEVKRRVELIGRNHEPGKPGKFIGESWIIALDHSAPASKVFKPTKKGPVPIVDAVFGALCKKGCSWCDEARALMKANRGED